MTTNKIKRLIVIILTEILYIVYNNYIVKLEYINLNFEWALRSNNLNIIQLQQKQCNELTHSRGLPPFKFSTDQVICRIWWKHELESRNRSIKIRTFGIRKNTNPKSLEMYMAGGFNCFDSETRVEKWSKKERAKPP